MSSTEDHQVVAESAAELLMRCLTPDQWQAVDAALRAEFAAARADAAAQALRETAHAWQWKEWTGLIPLSSTGPIAQAQYVTDWLRIRAGLEVPG